MSYSKLYDNDIDFIGAPSIDVVYYFDYNLDERLLRSAFAEIVRRFPELDLNLIRATDGSYWLKHQPGSWQFKHRKSSLSFIRPQSAEDMREAMNSVSSLPNEPVFSVLLTTFSSGCQLAFSVSHLVADGYSSRVIHEQLQCLMMGSQIPGQFDARSARSFIRLDPDIGSDEYAGFGKRASPSLQLTSIPAAMLTEWRNQNHSATDCSDVSLLIGHALCAVGDRIYPGKFPLRARIPVDVRRCLPAGDPLFFGNAIIDVVRDFDRSELMSLGATGTSKLISEATQGFRERLRRLCAKPSRVPLYERSWFMDIWHEVRLSGHYDSPGNIVFSSVLPPAEMNMGKGPPVDRLVSASASAQILMRRKGDEYLLTVSSPDPIDLSPLNQLALSNVSDQNEHPRVRD